jgi:hypothetical protein
VVAPSYRCLEGLLARHCGAGTAGEQLEPVAKPRGNLLGGQHSHPRRSKLEGQRDAIEATADLGYRARIRRGQRETGTGPARSLREQLHRFEPA